LLSINGRRPAAPYVGCERAAVRRRIANGGPMPLLEWSAKYSVNVRELDWQHQQLFGMLNELYDAMQTGQGRAIVGDVLERLLNYTQYHFTSEEALFREHGYREDAAHRAEHAALSSRTLALQRRLEAGEIGVAAETLRFMADWLKSHIVGTDMKYVEFLNAKGVH
jgi:hemerythrin